MNCCLYPLFERRIVGRISFLNWWWLFFLLFGSPAGEDVQPCVSDFVFSQPNFLDFFRLFFNLLVASAAAYIFLASLLKALLAKASTFFISSSSFFSSVACSLAAFFGPPWLVFFQVLTTPYCLLTALSLPACI